MLLGFALDAALGFLSIYYQVGVVNEYVLISLVPHCVCGIAKVESHPLFIYRVEEDFVDEVPRCGGAAASLSGAEVFVVSC